MKPIDNTWNRRWIGVGMKSGGQVAVIGLESTGAFMVNLGNHETFWLRILNARYGPGLGGSAGAVAVLAWGLIEPYDLHGQEISEWGFNVSVAEKLASGSLKQSLQMFEQLNQLWDSRKGLYNVLDGAMSMISTVEQIKRRLTSFFVMCEAGKRRGVVTIDIPSAGYGVELSAYVTRGHMAVQNSSSMDLGNYR